MVYIHPFAEEMNKSRRMAALQSRALAAAGFSVLQIDLHGCGDSSGEFGDASWQDWIVDALHAAAWLKARDQAHANAPLWFWSLRAGCLIAMQAAANLNEHVNFCFWQPSPSGKLVLQQFLRLKIAAAMLSGASKGLMDEMKRKLAQGQSVEVAGYSLSAQLAEGLEQASLMPDTRASQNAASCSRMECLELSMQENASAAPATKHCLTNWRSLGYATQHRLVQGPAFWQSQEIEDAPALIEATCAALLNEYSGSIQAAKVPTWN